MLRRLVLLAGLLCVNAVPQPGGLLGSFVRRVTGAEEPGEFEELVEELRERLWSDDAGSMAQFDDELVVPDGATEAVEVDETLVLPPIFPTKKAYEEYRKERSRLFEVDPYKTKFVAEEFPVRGKAQDFSWKSRVVVPNPWKILGTMLNLQGVNVHKVKNEDTGETWVEVHERPEKRFNPVKRARHMLGRLVPLEIDSRLAPVAEPKERALSKREVKRRYGDRAKEATANVSERSGFQKVAFPKTEDLLGSKKGADAMVRKLYEVAEGKAAE